MQMIEKYMEHINEEMEGAMNYAEKFVIYKGTKPQWAQMFHDMAAQEIVHADYLRRMAQESIDTFSYVPEDAKDKWEHCMKHQAEKEGVIKFMLSR